MGEITEHHHDIGAIDERMRECRIQSLVCVTQAKGVVPFGGLHPLERDVRVGDHAQPQHTRADSLARRASIVERRNATA